MMPPSPRRACQKAEALPPRRPFVDLRSASTSSLVKRLWGGYLSPYWPKLVLALLAMVVYAASAAAIPAGVEWINASFSGEKPTFSLGDRNVAVWGPVLIILLGAANALSQYVQARLSASASLSALRDMQVEMIEALVRVDDRQLRQFGSGQTISRLTNDTTILRETLSRTLTAIRDLLTLLSLCAVMVWYDWALFLTVIAVYGVVGWPVARIGKYLRKNSREAQQQTGELAHIAQELVAGGRVIRAFQMEERETERGRAAANDRLQILQKMARLRALNEPFIFFVGSAALAIVVCIVAIRIDAGALSASQFISFIIALLMLSQPARGLATLNAVAQEGFGAFERILDVIDARPSITDRAGAAALNARAGAISFQNVQFTYDGDAPALNDFSLDLKPGMTTALIGESGAGKSTVFNLLLRFYEPLSGSIFIDGAEIRTVTLESLRRAIAIVSQEAVLFDDTVAANIGFGRAHATRDEIINAAIAASADEFIRALPNGYDTRVGEAGLNLSGGQRQRIAIARAFLKDAPILLLDEATSALDAASEVAVQAAFARLSKGRTTLVIAHRLATIRSADLIVSMSNGKVIETGDHDELMRRDGYYARVAQLQFS